jgi:hypothetical protein
MKYNKLIILSIAAFLLSLPSISSAAVGAYNCYNINWERETGGNNAVFDGVRCVLTSDPHFTNTYETCREEYLTSSGFYTPSGFATYGPTFTEVNYMGPICVQANIIPTVPVLGGTTSITAGATTANTVTSTDTDGDTIMYDIDWDGNGTVDGTTGYFASGAVVPIGRIYSAAGTYSVKARARDSVGGVSAWSAGWTITVTASTFNCEASQFNPGLSIINTFAALFRRLDPGQRIFNSNLTNKCYGNTSGVSYFVPFKTTAEINAFNNNLPPGVTKSNGAW